MITVTTKVHFTTAKAGRKKLSAGPRLVEAQQGRTPRISKLMALAIRFDGLLREGKVADMSELARLAHVTQPRMTQIMNLSHLAPDIQEELLFLRPVRNGRDVIHERMLRKVCAESRWTTQRDVWKRLRPRSARDRGLQPRGTG